MCDFVCSRGDQELLLTKVCNRPQHCAVGSCDCSRHAGAGWRWRRRSRRSNDASNNTVLPVLSAYSFSQQPFDCVTSQQLCHSSERQCLYIFIYLYILGLYFTHTRARHHHYCQHRQHRHRQHHESVFFSSIKAPCVFHVCHVAAMCRNECNECNESLPTQQVVLL